MLKVLGEAELMLNSPCSAIGDSRVEPEKGNEGRPASNPSGRAAAAGAGKDETATREEEDNGTAIA